MVEQFYTTQELGQKLALRPQTIRAYLRGGKITGSKIGNRWRIGERDIEKFLTSGSS